MDFFFFKFKKALKKRYYILLMPLIDIYHLNEINREKRDVKQGKQIRVKKGLTKSATYPSWSLPLATSLVEKLPHWHQT